ncbi:hypothetical protein [Aquipseudomonas alcaligenes]|uniref:Uncharacterized protein n=1 Tax=Aquipseudomonas alcaligenes (strain ATCC 14909 / DSM 50342 / CCUG 1425 / JCM 20561 / NBRC 14159 / NCIMB 9945 / NCTC 10367 / 1577) TaxID=1215092 RepID=U2Z0S6_AQUA1|nr:hypothetical protein [Pseudomonas alcaligenes]GAD61341.1 hypothetical protein PA6_005_02300 [Pseudomonas alcaligenes NBRC 14159]SUD14391.1 Uncharacterised protein [Pseudomonas alcaligenes]
MKKQDIEENGQATLDLEESVNLRLRELLERRKAQDLEGGTANRTRGHATRVLRPRLEELREMVVYGLSMREITDLLGEGGVQVNYHSLRAFLQRYLPREYAEYLVAKKPGDPHFGKEIPPEVLEIDTPPEFRQPEGTGAGKQKEEAKPVTKPAATGERKPPMRPRGQLRADADRIDLDDVPD